MDRLIEFLEILVQESFLLFWRIASYNPVVGWALDRPVFE